MEHWQNISLDNLSQIYEGILYIEEWECINGYEGLYEVSSFGRIKSLPHKYIDTKGRNYRKKERIIRPQNDCKRGYLKVRIYKNGVGSSFSIHRLVAIAFIPNPASLPEVNHKWGVKIDNRVSELEWSTSSDNQQHAYDVLNRNKPLLGKFGKDHHTSIRINQYDLNSSFIKTWDSINDVQRAGIANAQTIIRCLKGRSKSNQAKGYKWEYA